MIESENSFSIKCYIIIVFVERFIPKDGVPKYGLPIILFKRDLSEGKNCWPKKNSEKAKHPEICPSFSGTVPET